MSVVVNRSGRSSVKCADLFPLKRVLRRKKVKAQYDRLCSGACMSTPPEKAQQESWDLRNNNIVSPLLF